MSLHSTLFSIYNNVPFLPIYKSNDINNLLLDIDYPSFLKYNLEKDCKGSPITLSNKILCNKVNSLLENKNTVKNLKKYLKTVCDQIQTDLSKSIPRLLDIIVNEISKFKQPLLTTHPITMVENNIENNHFIYSNKNEDVLFTGFNKKEEVALREIISFAKLKLKLNNYCEVCDFRKIEDPKKQEIIVSIISYYLTGGDIHSVFCNTLKEKIFLSNNGCIEYNYINDWKRIIKENLVNGGRLPILLINNLSTSLKPPSIVIDEKPQILTKKYINESEKVKNLYLYEDDKKTSVIQFNIHYINQENKNGEHCSGWNYLYHELKKYHTNDNDASLLDMYIERTFQFEKDVLKAIGIVPYRKKWRGFIHHSFKSFANRYKNTVHLLETPEFVESLPFCECIYVFSKTLELEVKLELLKIGWEKLSVVSLIQPAEIKSVIPFRYSTFLENNEKHILHIGERLVNTFTFYQLQLPSSIKIVSNDLMERLVQRIGLKKKTTVPLTKAILLNLNNNIFYSPNGVGESMLNEIQKKSNNNILNDQFYNFFENLTEGLEKKKKLENEEYNELLSKNIVFLHLDDFSEINTIINCCVRNCPFIVNRHPAVVELVGNKYPLFYEFESAKIETSTFFEINKQIEVLFKDSSIIYKTYKYLCSLDKKRFHINNIIGVNEIF